MQVNGIGWTGVLTEHFESTLSFFSDVLGLHMAYRDESKELAHFRFRSGQLLEIYGPSNRARKEKYRWFQGPALGFEVEDVASARQEMLARGACFITELESWENEVWTMFLGPENRLFEIASPARSPARHSAGILGICRASLCVEDLAAALRFFSQVMDMPLIVQEGQEAARCWLPAGHLFGIESSKTKRGQLTLHTIVGLEVENIVEARRDMESRGVEFIGPTETDADGSASAYFCAPDGFVYELVYTPHPPN